MEGSILVTGATGFVAGHIIEQLLVKGYQVRGTVRSLSSPEKVAHLREMPNSENLELVEANLLSEDGWNEATKDIKICMHTASPYVLSVEDAQKDLVDPAVNGTKFVLKACKENGVEKVIVTSSMAAITDEPEKNYIYTEADWNEKSSLNRNPYYYSKVLAERTAWDFVKENNNPFKLIVINPFLIIGPAHTSTINPSCKLFNDLLDGVYPGIMDVGWGLVDVRDVAKAHILAMESKDAEGRYLTCNETLPMRTVCEKLNEWYPGYNVPHMGLDCKIGTKFVKMAARFQDPGTRDYLRTNLGTFPKYDHSKVEGLGLNFRPVDESIKDTVDDLLKWKHIKTVPKVKKEK